VTRGPSGDIDLDDDVGKGLVAGRDERHRDEVLARRRVRRHLDLEWLGDLGLPGHRSVPPPGATVTPDPAGVEAGQVTDRRWPSCPALRA